MTRFGKTQQIKVSGKSGSQFVTTSAGRTAGANEGGIFDMLPKMLLAVPHSLFIDHASEDFNCGNGSKYFLSRHIGVIDSYNCDGSRCSSKNVFPYLLQFGFD